MEPQIIPRKEHRISRKQISPNALRTLYRLYEHGFTAYLVGGCVRDLLLGRTPKDFDIATNATPTQIKRLFRNCRLIGRRFRLAHLHFRDEILEVATFRRAALPSDAAEIEETGHHHHVKDKDGMLLRDNLFGNPEEDALCRDFTVNALAYNLADFSVIDYSTGLSDLRQRLIRPIGDPYVRFTEDPVRMLRAVRFSASHGLAVEPTTWETIRVLAPIISRVSPARLYEEIQKVFLLGHARSSINLLMESGLLAALFPGLSRWIDGSSPRLALLQGNLEYLDQLWRSGTPPSPPFFLAILFGPLLEEDAVERRREGIPYQQALDLACASFLQEALKTVTIPGKISTLLRDILALQPSLHRMPPRRPASLMKRPGFTDALAYLRLTSETRKENRTPLKWWDTFLSSAPPAPEPEALVESKPPRKKRRKRRRRPHGLRTTQPAAADGQKSEA